MTLIELEMESWKHIILELEWILNIVQSNLCHFWYDPRTTMLPTNLVTDVFIQ